MDDETPFPGYCPFCTAEVEFTEYLREERLNDRIVNSELSYTCHNCNTLFMVSSNYADQDFIDDCEALRANLKIMEYIDDDAL